MVKTLSEEQVRRLLDPLATVEAVENAFRRGPGSVAMPPRTHSPLASGGVFLAMLCYQSETSLVGMKLVTVNPRPERRDERIQAVYVLLDAGTGRPLLMLEANYLTDLRTAATSAVATRHLARPEASTLGIFGTGRQARAHLQLFCRMWKYERVLACGSNASRSAEFAGEMTKQLGLRVLPADPRTCAAESDVICTCTSSNTPLFDGAVLRQGTHLNLVGTFQPTAREVDTRTVERSRIVVETYEAALAEPGDLLMPMAEGKISRSDIRADLHELVCGRKVRLNTGDITLFKSVGCALEDLAAAELIWKAVQASPGAEA